jgi:hypothetical protein
MAAPKRPVQRFVSKKCPYCFVYLPLQAERCHSCKRKVGQADDFGMARKPVDWKAYAICLVAWVAFVYYIWRVFFKT